MESMDKALSLWPQSANDTRTRLSSVMEDVEVSMDSLLHSRQHLTTAPKEGALAAGIPRTDFNRRTTRSQAAA